MLRILTLTGIMTAFAAMALVAAVEPAVAGSGPRTHLLAIGICLPWKTDGRVSPACANNVAAMKEAAGAAMRVADADIVTLLNAAATYEGLDEAFDLVAGSRPA